MTTATGSSLILPSALSPPSAVTTRKSSPANVISRTLRIVALSSTASRVLGTCVLLVAWSPAPTEHRHELSGRRKADPITYTTTAAAEAFCLAPRRRACLFFRGLQACRGLVLGAGASHHAG